MIGSRATSGSVAITFRNVRIASLALEQVGVHVDVEDVGAAAHLLERDLDGAGEVAGLDQAAEACRAGDVRPLADQHEARVGADLERLEPAPARARRGLGRPARREPATAAAIAAVCAGVEPQQLPAMFRKPASANSREQAARDLGRLVVAAEGVREAGVRVGADEAGRDPRQLGDVGPHLAARRASS